MGITQLSLSLYILNNLINYSGYFSIDNVKQRMKHMYKSEEHRADVRMLMMLVYVPATDIPVRRR